MDCPLCQKKFPANEIEAHVNTCLDSGGAIEPTTPTKPMEIDPPITKPKPVQPTTTTTTTKKEVDEAISEEDLAKMQEEAYTFWIERRKQEEEDMRLAKEMEKAPQPPKPTPPVYVPPPKPAEPVMSDTELARKLQMEEEEAIKQAKREKDEADRLLAQELWKAEEEAEAERKKKKEWEETLRMIKQEVKKEADGELAAALREKERLLRELQELKAEEAKTGPKHVAVNIEGIDYPATWEHQRGDHQIFTVNKGSEEYNDIAHHFTSTLGGGYGGGTITKIERIQNRTQWMFYFLRREQVAAKNSKNANEKLLFHGSRNNAYDSIMKEGFDHRVANMGGAIGAGVYFATHASTSMGYVAPTKWGDKKMLYCRVTLGSVGTGQSGIRRPPDKQGGGIHDSVGQVHGGNGMYVVFDNHQAYPEYMIYFK